MSEKSRTLTAGNRTIDVSRPDKLMFPDDGITKYDLAEYYARIAGHSIDLWRDRPLSMQRFPDGIDGKSFFQKDVPDYFPDWVERIRLEKEGGHVDYILGNNAATLAYIADQGCITPHIGLSRIDRIENPDRLIFDLDPSDDDFGKVQLAASKLRDFLNEIGVASFVQTTGSRGLHLFVPLDRSVGFDAVRESAHRLAEALAERNPDDLTVEQRKDKRGQRVFLDYLRNAYGQTAVAPYGVRAKPGAPVATPLDWDEALSSDMTPRKFGLRNIFRRLSQKEDPWRGMARHAVSARKLEEKLSAL